jgi:flagellar motor switch protein FliG
MADGSGLEGIERAAVLLMSLGEEGAAEVMRFLSPKELQRLGEAMARTGAISRSQMTGVLGAFRNAIDEQTSFGVDAPTFVRRALISAVGEQRADSIIGNVIDRDLGNGLSALKWMNAKSVAEVIKGEHPQIIAMCLSFLEPDQSAGVMEHLADNLVPDVLMRLATLDSVRPEALRELDAVLEEQVIDQGQINALGNAGVRGVAEILNLVGGQAEQNILEEIGQVDPELATRIQDSMFVFESLKDLDQKGMQVLLREVESDLLLVALKGADDELTEKFLSNMSKRAAQMLKEDMESQGPVRVSEVEAAQREVLNTARRLAEAGELMLGGGADDFL